MYKDIQMMRKKFSCLKHVSCNTDEVDLGEITAQGDFVLVYHISRDEMER